MSRKNKLILLLVSIGVFAFILIAVLISLLQQKKLENPIGTIGNTAGNLYNSGYYCEKDGVVYFANASDGGVLYSMNPDETNVRRLSNAIALNLLADSNYLYYFQLGTYGNGSFDNVISNRSFMRSNHKGQKIKNLTKEIVVSAQLVDNYLYYLTTDNKKIRFYKSDTEHNNVIDLADYIIQPACVNDSRIYYSGTLEDHCLYALNTTNDVQTQVWDAELWYPIFYNDYLYYLNVDKNYRLERYSFSNDAVQVLTEDRVDSYNIGSGYIYYQKNSTTEPQLMCMRSDGTDAIVLAKGNYAKINMTSEYVYFQEFGVRDVVYHSPIGSASYSVFDVK